MTRLWVRAEYRPNEDRVGLTPGGAKELMNAGFDIIVEDSPTRAIETGAYRAVGCTIAEKYSWPDAPQEEIIFGLKDLPEDGTPLRHRHIMFGHAFKGQHNGAGLLRRFKAGGGTLFDLEYLVDERGRRVAAFGYWAGYAGAMVALHCWIAQQQYGICGSVSAYQDRAAAVADLGAALKTCAEPQPTAIVIGALGRVGSGAVDLCTALEIEVTKWDMEETASGGPFPEILQHDLFFNCILACLGTPVFVPPAMLSQSRRLRVISDIACDPYSDYNPIPIYSAATDWAAPALRIANDPVLDVIAIDNLPSLLPLESSQDFSTQLLPTLRDLDKLDKGIWQRAQAVFEQQVSEV